MKRKYIKDDISAGAAQRLFVALCVCAAITVATFSSTSAQQPAIVHVDKTREVPMTQTMPVLGRLVALRSGDVAARIAGSVAEVRVQVGDRVEEGQSIARFEDEKLKADLQVAEGELAVAEAELGTARAEADLAEQAVRRLAGLRRSAAFNQANFEDAQLQQKAALAKVVRAEANRDVKQAALERSKLDLAYAEIKAPYDGVVLQRLTESGAYLNIGQPIVRLIGAKQLEAEADIPATWLSGLQAGQSYGLQLGDGPELQGTLRAILPAENSLTRTRTARFSVAFGDEDLRLAEGQSITVHVPTGAERQVLTVHKDAILKQMGNSIVYVVGEDQKAQLRPVQLGEAVNGRFEVLSGLKAGEQAVIRGNERLQPGAPVKIEEGSS